MNRKTLAEMVSQRGQAAVAKALGVSGPAICKALSRGRVIYVFEHEDGRFTAEEVKKFPAQKPA